MFSVAINFVWFHAEARITCISESVEIVIFSLMAERISRENIRDIFFSYRRRMIYSNILSPTKSILRHIQTHTTMLDYRAYIICIFELHPKRVKLYTIIDFMINGSLIFLLLPLLQFYGHFCAQGRLSGPSVLQG